MVALFTWKARQIFGLTGAVFHFVLTSNCLFHLLGRWDGMLLNVLWTCHRRLIRAENWRKLKKTLGLNKFDMKLSMTFIDMQQSHTLYGWVMSRRALCDIVTVVNSRFPLDRYRQKARLQNMPHFPHFHIAFTYADVLQNILLEYDRLLNDETHRQISANDVCEAFDGNTY